MVRTVGTAIKTGGGKSSKAGHSVSSGQSNTSNVSSRNKGGFIGRNKLVPRPTPNWQQPITSFFRGNSTGINVPSEPVQSSEELFASEQVQSSQEIIPSEKDSEYVGTNTILKPPEWQTPIITFLGKKHLASESKSEAGGSLQPKENVVPADGNKGIKNKSEDQLDNPTKHTKISYKELENIEFS